jgi:hypothetical protein
MKRIRAWWCARFGHDWRFVRYHVKTFIGSDIPDLVIDEECARCGETRARVVGPVRVTMTVEVEK